MPNVEIYIIFLGIIAAVGAVFSKSPVPTSLFLVMAGMLLSLIPSFPHVDLKPEVVLDIFLPLLLYEASAYTSWRDFKINLHPIVLLSIGHVLFITLLVAVAIHFLIPNLGWPLAFLLGAVISPPDDVAIISIAEKIHMPQRIVTILKGEGMLNDATVLIIFQFSLAAIVTHEFSAINAISTFLIVIVAETIYGLALGYIIGEMRLKLHDPILQMLISIMTPLLAYFPAERLGGCGVLATVVTGLFIGHSYSEKFAPEVRLVSRSVWTTLGFLIQSILFLLVGLDLRFIFERISSIPITTLALYSTVVISVVIIGRFIWVYGATYSPKLLFPKRHKSNRYPPWQYPFLISWAGMRGGISLAAALAVPSLPMMANNTNPRDLLVFLVFSVIIATLLLQGSAIPWVLRALQIHTHGQREKHHEYLTELSARISISTAVLNWLLEYKNQAVNPKLAEAIEVRIKEYETLRKQLEESIINHKTMRTSDKNSTHNATFKETLSLPAKIIEIERKELSRLWHEERINHSVKNKLLQQLDLRSKHVNSL